MTNTHPGNQLKTVLKRASEWAETQREAAKSMSQAMSRSVPGWRKTLLAYKQDKSKLNPFEEPDVGKSTHACVRSRTKQSLDDVLDKLKGQLAREDLERQKAGVTFPHKVSPSEFLQHALKIEAAQ